MNKMISDCPICGNLKCVEVTTKTDNIPYFGEIMETTLQCRECGYKHADTICLEQKDPVHYTLLIGKDQLNARVIKSQSSTLSIPELGLKVEPGPKSQGYVSNVEGVLERFEKAVKTALSWTDDPEVKDNAQRILESLHQVRYGERHTELIVEDPFGHSAIIHRRARKRGLTEEE
ncbi:MAG: ZPR1 zinc finger domain-containing protein, partial [Methanobacteriaceae archaeon]|nr:ZPR1 zinc finger domain-containing protein [Methanobacteriaceae archaeon]